MFSIHFTSSNEKTKYKMLDSVIPREVVKRYVWFNDEDEDQVFMINENNDFLFKKSCLYVENHSLGEWFQRRL